MPDEEKPTSEQTPDGAPETVESGNPAKKITYWLGIATGVVALLGTLAGIGVSIWGLVDKSHADKLAADTNLKITQAKAISDETIAKDKAASDLDIAKKQLAAHEEEYTFQATQHSIELKSQDEEKARAEKSAEELRLSTAISNLFTASGSADGQIAVLSSFAKQNTKHDEMIADALLAKLASPQALTTNELIFDVVEKFGLERRLDLLLRANRRGRAQFDAALEELFMLKLDAAMSSITPEKPASGGAANFRDFYNYTLRTLAAQTRKTGEEMLKESEAQPNPFGSGYVSATLNSRISPIVNLELLWAPTDPVTGGMVKPEDFNEAWWSRIQARIRSHRYSSENDLKTTLVSSWDILTITSRIIPASLLGFAGNDRLTPFQLNGCYFAQQDWPIGIYPPIDFGDSVADFRQLEDARFDSPTQASLSRATHIKPSNDSMLGEEFSRNPLVKAVPFAK